MEKIVGLPPRPPAQVAGVAASVDECIGAICLWLGCLPSIALATRFAFPDSVPCNWSSLTCATSRVTRSQSWNEPQRKMQPGMHDVVTFRFIRAVGKIRGTGEKYGGENHVRIWFWWKEGRTIYMLEDITWSNSCLVIVRNENLYKSSKNEN